MKLFNQVRKYGPTLSQKAATVGALALLGASSAMAQAVAGPFDAFFDAIGLSGVAAKVIAVGVIIVGIALAFKGPDVAKRVIRKV